MIIISTSRLVAVDLSRVGAGAAICRESSVFAVDIHILQFIGDNESRLGLANCPEARVLWYRTALGLLDQVSVA